MSGSNSLVTRTGYLLPLYDLETPQLSSTMTASVVSTSAQILLVNGLAVTCNTNASLSGRYAADAASLAILLGVQYFIDRNARFPGNSGQYVVADMTGNPHVFTTAIVTGGAPPPSFTQLVYALADFAAGCAMVAITGAGTLPAATATID